MSEVPLYTGTSLNDEVHPRFHPPGGGGQHHYRAIWTTRPRPPHGVYVRIVPRAAVPLFMHICTDVRPYRGTSLIRNRPPVGPYSTGVTRN